MNINELEGKELAEAVATKVMKWTALREPGKAHLWVESGYFISGWRPDRDISAAWMVVEKLTDLSLEDKMRTFRLVRASRWSEPKGEYNPWGYDAYFGPRYDPRHHRELVAWADIAPLAICLSALKAVEADK